MQYPWGFLVVKIFISPPSPPHTHSMSLKFVKSFKSFYPSRKQPAGWDAVKGRFHQVVWSSNTFTTIFDSNSCWICVKIKFILYGHGHVVLSDRYCRPTTELSAVSLIFWLFIVFHCIFILTRELNIKCQWRKEIPWERRHMLETASIKFSIFFLSGIMIPWHTAQ